jgi:hypothetical protein
LPKLTITGPATPPPGFGVARDGIALDLAALGSALYVDPGPHEITASAPGFEPFKTTVTVSEAQSESVVLPELVREKTPPVEPQPRPRPEQPEVPVGGAEQARTRKLIGIGVAGGGALLTGVGLFLGARASSTYDDAKALCGAELICENDTDFEKGKDLIDRARTQATVSTVLVVSGIAAAAAGVVVWFTAPKRERAETAVVPVVTDRDLGVAVMGRF